MSNKTVPRPDSHQRMDLNDYLCQGCGACVAVCETGALFLVRTHLNINQSACTACERCLKACPSHALSLVDLIPA
jgi:ferredoxin